MRICRGFLLPLHPKQKKTKLNVMFVAQHIINGTFLR